MKSKKDNRYKLQLNYENVFFSDYGGGEVYIPEGECPQGYKRNSKNQCEKACANCKTYTTTNPKGLLDVKLDDYQESGCGECVSCTCNQQGDNMCNTGNNRRCDNYKLNEYIRFI